MIQRNKVSPSPDLYRLWRGGQQANYSLWQVLHVGALSTVIVVDAEEATSKGRYLAKGNQYGAVDDATGLDPEAEVEEQ